MWKGGNMKKSCQELGIFFLVLIIGVLAPQFVYSGIEWTLKKQINLNVQPLDIATSTDGNLIFVLAPGEILVYSNAEGKIASRIPIDKEFDRVTYAGKNNVLILTSNSSKTLKIIQVDFLFDIALNDLPFKGPADALVTIAVFNDYQ